MKSSDIFDLCNQTNNSYKKSKGFDSAQSSWDNAHPNDEYEPETTETEKQAHDAYKFCMKLAIEGLTKQMELYKNYGKTDTADLIENDIQEITAEVARRELKFV